MTSVYLSDAASGLLDKIGTPALYPVARALDSLRSRSSRSAGLPIGDDKSDLWAIRAGRFQVLYEFDAHLDSVYVIDLVERKWSSPLATTRGVNLGEPLADRLSGFREDLREMWSCMMIDAEAYGRFGRTAIVGFRYIFAVVRLSFSALLQIIGGRSSRRRAD